MRRERMQVEEESPYYGVREMGYDDFVSDKNLYFIMSSFYNNLNVYPKVELKYKG